MCLNIVEGICNIVMGNVYFNSDGNQGNNFDFWEKELTREGYTE